MIAAAAALAVAIGTTAASADEGPTLPIGRYLKEPDELALITGGTLIVTDVTVATLVTLDALRNRDSDSALHFIAALAVAPQAIAFGASGFIYDISRWDAVDNLLLLLPAEFLTATVGTYGIWSLSSKSLSPGPRLGVSALVGLNYTFTVTALGCARHGKVAPFDVAVTQSVLSGLEFGFTIERAIDDPEHATEWGLMTAWAAGLFAHGVTSAVTAERTEPWGRDSLAMTPYLAPTPTGGSFGVAGRL